MPLLVKLIFTSEHLSVQVHPADGECEPRGKTEMWHILSAEKDAKIALGFREPITRDQLRESCATGAIEELLNWFPVRAGETYFTPAHTVHAIGAGIVLCEIQQHCDVTYRLWDYGRPREMHVEQAAAIADLGIHPGSAKPEKVAEGRELLVRSEHFVTESVSLEPGGRLELPPEECQLLICIEGPAVIGGRAAGLGEVWRLPGDQPTTVEAGATARLLRTYVP
ncbi:MAG: class I mannose-6-phosphate isomerase [Acidobacteriia bacterium]|nr:class I mannose-6-phosphate isomerase [Terriglobia bacterium]